MRSHSRDRERRSSSRDKERRSCSKDNEEKSHSESKENAVKSKQVLDTFHFFKLLYSLIISHSRWRR